MPFNDASTGELAAFQPAADHPRKIALVAFLPIHRQRDSAEFCHIYAEHLGGSGLVAFAGVQHLVDVLLFLPGEELGERRPVLQFPQSERELLRRHDARLGRGDDLGDHLIKLGQVARPVIGRHDGKRVVSEFDELRIEERIGALPRIVLHQERNILRAVAERCELHRQRRHAIK